MPAFFTPLAALGAGLIRRPRVRTAIALTTLTAALFALYTMLALQSPAPWLKDTRTGWILTVGAHDATVASLHATANCAHFHFRCLFNQCSRLSRRSLSFSFRQFINTSSPTIRRDSRILASLIKCVECRCIGSDSLALGKSVIYMIVPRLDWQSHLRDSRLPRHQRSRPVRRRGTMRASGVY